MSQRVYMKKALELFNTASAIEKDLNVPMASMVHEVFDLAEEAATKGQFSVLIDLDVTLENSDIVNILKSWGYTTLVIKSNSFGDPTRILISWVVLKLNKISLV